MKNEGSKYNIAQHLWDPADRHVWKGMYAPQNKSVIQFSEEVLKDRYALRKRFVWYGVFPFLVLGFVLLTPVFDWWVGLWGAWKWMGTGVAFITLLWTPFLLLWDRNRQLKRRIVFYLLAQKNNWECFYQDIHVHWENMNVLFPDLFFKGEQKRRLFDQLWGFYDFRGHKIDFWTGSFGYETVTGKRGEVAQTKKHQCLNFILHLPKRSPQTLLWKSKGLYVDDAPCPMTAAVGKVSEPLLMSLKYIKDKYNADILLQGQNLVVQIPHREFFTDPKTNFLKKGVLHKADEEELKKFWRSFDDVLICFL